MEMKGQVISGEFSKIIVRQKSQTPLELGELLISEHGQTKILLQVYDLVYGSQISQQQLEHISGLNLEEGIQEELMEKNIRTYTLAYLKTLLNIQSNDSVIAKNLPIVFSPVRDVAKEDLVFLTKPEKPLAIGKLRSGSKMLDVDIFLEGDKVFSEHILIVAATGKGKSNLASCMLWDALQRDYCGILVLDPHDEYYGRTGEGLKDRKDVDSLVYYTPKNAPSGTNTLKINIKTIKPAHFDGAMNWTEAQKEALDAYYRKFGEEWISAILTDHIIENFHEATIGVLKRRMQSLLDIDIVEGKLFSRGVFDFQSGQTTIVDICIALEQAKVVVIDTSHFSGAVEILVGSLITTEILERYKRYKLMGMLNDKPCVSVFLEEAPRVLGKEVLEQGPNIFSTVAREGRKFKVGLTAITQLPSLIPKTVLSNMNTKIILGIEMAVERQAVIESANQDLSADARAIASLDKGEAIITSSFAKFALPIKVPFFKKVVQDAQNTHMKEKYINKFPGSA